MRHGSVGGQAVLEFQKGQTPMKNGQTHVLALLANISGDTPAGPSEVYATLVAGMEQGN